MDRRTRLKALEVHSISSPTGLGVASQLDCQVSEMVKISHPLWMPVYCLGGPLKRHRVRDVPMVVPGCLLGARLAGDGAVEVHKPHGPQALIADHEPRRSDRDGRQFRDDRPIAVPPLGVKYDAAERNPAPDYVFDCSRGRAKQDDQKLAIGLIDYLPIDSLLG